MNQETILTPIQDLLWDIDLSTFDPNQHKKFLAERIAEKGDTRALSWYFKLFGQSYFLQVIKSSPNVSRQTRNFWLKYQAFDSE